ncbi:MULTISPECIES: potassium channel family protein [Pontibacillus]|uniref:Potassium channel family protein n=1 Tax=Pontibacillus chungwhensis TaxID=265426 RepID=A0ABY8UYE3_9BACI|nr:MULTISPECIES: potassium channel family protein [Pontibacillus]MCD5325568.1 potassium channel family protein [Pontibacillus sp. HN14]WIF98676.1 potassium channel family protein [Pontibacillus chungwhensis]
MGWVMLIFVVVSVCGSVAGFFHGDREVRQLFSFHHFYTLIAVYGIVMLGFGLIYFILASEGLVILQDELLLEDSLLDRLAHSVYFSGVTLMTVGYGDITPVGLGRVVALIEAMIGYVLPAAFFVQYMHHHHQDEPPDKL